MLELILEFYKALIIIAALSTLFSFLFIYKGISNRIQKKVDILWIFFGVVAIVLITENNRKDYFQEKFYDYQNLVERNKDYVIYDLDRANHCEGAEKYTEGISDEKLIKLQNSEKAYCKWTKTMKQKLLSQIEPEEVEILPPSGFEDIPYLVEEYQIYVDFIESYNEIVIEYLGYKNYLFEESLLGYMNLVGSIFLYLALSLRFSLSVYLYWESKRPEMEFK